MDPQNKPFPLLRNIVSCRANQPGPDTDVKYGPDRSLCDGIDDTDFSKSINQSGSDILPLSMTESEADDHFELRKVHVSGLNIDGTNQLDFSTSWPLTPQAEDVLGQLKNESTNQPCSRTLVRKDIWVPSFFIQGSMILLLVTPTVVILSCKVKPTTGQLFEPNSSSYFEQQKYLLLNIQASMFTFWMILWSYC